MLFAHLIEARGYILRLGIFLKNVFPEWCVRISCFAYTKCWRNWFVFKLQRNSTAGDSSNSVLATSLCWLQKWHTSLTRNSARLCRLGHATSAASPFLAPPSLRISHSARHLLHRTPFAGGWNFRDFFPTCATPASHRAVKHIPTKFLNLPNYTKNLKLRNTRYSYAIFPGMELQLWPYLWTMQNNRRKLHDYAEIVWLCDMAFIMRLLV